MKETPRRIDVSRASSAVPLIERSVFKALRVVRDMDVRSIRSLGRTLTNANVQALRYVSRFQNPKVINGLPIHQLIGRRETLNRPPAGICRRKLLPRFAPR